ncbi:PspC domain-containing protein [Eubacteriales bacterium mix99]
MSSKKLYRSAKQRVLAGVCGGLAEYFDIDVTMVRLIWALSVLPGGIGLILYIAAIIIIPKGENGKGTVITDEDGKEIYVSEDEDAGTIRHNSMLFIGIILIVLGGLTLLSRLYPFRIFWNQVGKYGWPIVLILIGIVILVTAFQNKGR